MGAWAKLDGSQVVWSDGDGVQVTSVLFWNPAGAAATTAAAARPAKMEMDFMMLMFSLHLELSNTAVV